MAQIKYWYFQTIIKVYLLTYVMLITKKNIIIVFVVDFFYYTCAYKETLETKKNISLIVLHKFLTSSWS